MSKYFRGRFAQGGISGPNLRPKLLVSNLVSKIARPDFDGRFFRAQLGPKNLWANSGFKIIRVRFRQGGILGRTWAQKCFGELGLEMVGPRFGRGLVLGPTWAEKFSAPLLVQTSLGPNRDGRNILAPLGPEMFGPKLVSKIMGPNLEERSFRAQVGPKDIPAQLEPKNRCVKFAKGCIFGFNLGPNFFPLQKVHQVPRPNSDGVLFSGLPLAAECLGPTWVQESLGPICEGSNSWTEFEPKNSWAYLGGVDFLFQAGSGVCLGFDI